MGNVIIAILVMGAVAGGAYYYENQAKQVIEQSDQQKINQLQKQASDLQSQNDQLQAELAKVQSEENYLAAQNDSLNKALAQYNATGKMPKLKLPYPPK